MDASVGKDHNHRLSAVEARALFAHHLTPYMAADAAVKLAIEERKRVKKLAKVDGILSRDLDYAVRCATIEDPEILLAEQAQRARILAWQGLMPGTQSDFDFAAAADREPAIDRAAREGEAAGFNGRDPTPPHDISTPQGQAWLAAWHKGNETRMDALKTALLKVSAGRTNPHDEGDDEEGED